MEVQKVGQIKREQDIKVGVTSKPAKMDLVCLALYLEPPINSAHHLNNPHDHVTIPHDHGTNPHDHLYDEVNRLQT